MSLQAKKNVEITVNSQEVLNSQSSFVGDAYSDISMEDSPLDLDEFSIEKLLNLEKSFTAQPLTENDKAESVEVNRNSELDMFGNDEDLLKAINEDPTWAVVSQASQTKNENQTTEATQNSQYEIEHSPISNLSDDDMELPEVSNMFDSLIQKMNMPQSSNSTSKNDSSVVEIPDSPERDIDALEDGFLNKLESMDVDDQKKVAIAEPSKRLPSPEPNPIVLGRTNLRKRKKIQLIPFTIDKLFYEKQIRDAAAKPRTRDIEAAGHDEDEDIDFTPSNTQAIDESADEISTYQNTQDSIFGLSTMKKADELNKSNIQPERTKDKGKARAKTSSVPNISSLSLGSVASTSNSIFSPTLSTSYNFEHIAGLGKLIPPPAEERRKKGKKKPITFTIKKRGSRRKGPRILSSNIQTQPNNIFPLNLKPKPSLNSQLNSIIDSSNSNTQSSNTNIDFSNELESIGSIDNPIEGYESPICSSGSLPEGDEDQDDEDDEVLVFRRVRKRKRAGIFDTDDEDDNSNQSKDSDTDSVIMMDPTEDSDSIFDFPLNSPEPSNRHVRRYAEDDIVPIVDDGFEYREPKRSRLGIKALPKKSLRNVLPKSFLKVNERKIQEEMRLREQKRKEAALKKAQAQTDAKKSSALSSSSSAVHRVHRDTEDVFAEFRNDSDKSDDDYDVDYGYDYDDTNPLAETFDDMIDKNEPTTEPINVEQSNSVNIAPIFQQRSRPITSTIQNNTSTSNNYSPHNIPIPLIRQSAYPLEAIENNRISGQPARSNNNQSVSRTPARPVKKSSIAITRPKNSKPRLTNLIKVRQNPAPVRRKRKPKRSRDDIYIHTPYYQSYGSGSGAVSHVHSNDATNHRNNTGNNVNFNNQVRADNHGYVSRGMFVGDNLPRKPFDDIYMNTKQQMWYKNDLIYVGNYDISDYLDQHITQAIPKRSAPTIYTLQYVTKQVGRLMDHELRRVIGLKNTVYWHHQLLQPLLSDSPNISPVYNKFKSTYSSLVLFDQVYFWKHIHPRQKHILNSLFARVFDDLYHMCNKDRYSRQPDMDGELPGHDHFYVFVSICLTQWLPHFSYEDKLQLAEIFANHIRGLAKMISNLLEGRSFEDVPWRAVIKAMLFILDWTCRLHHLGIDRAFWSVADCIQMLMDWLVYIGYDAIRNQNESQHYVIEAWICIIQLLSVSDRHGGYYYNEHIFISQLTKSIQEKSRITMVEYEKRKTTRLWAESLNLLLRNHMMLL